MCFLFEYTLFLKLKCALKSTLGPLRISSEGLCPKPMGWTRTCPIEHGRLSLRLHKARVDPTQTDINYRLPLTVLRGTVEGAVMMAGV